MVSLIIAPLSTISSLTAQSKHAIENADKLILQTKLHPSVKWIIDAQLDFSDMDDLYDSSYDFDELNERIAQRLIEYCSKSADASTLVYAAASRASMTQLYILLVKFAQKSDIRLTLLPAGGYFEAAYASLEAPFDINGVTLTTAVSLPARLDPRRPLCIEEIDTPLRASEVKLTLLEYYPDEFPVSLCVMNDNGDFVAKTIPLYELDRNKKDFFAATTLLVRAADLLELSRHYVDSLEDIVARLRAKGGCPWDAEQTHESLRASLIEETHEVLDAIDRCDMGALEEELGDLLLQVIFHAVIESELRDFDMRDVCTGIVNKLIYRHPHVFGDVAADSVAQVLSNWESLKQKEKHQDTIASTMRAVVPSFPALMYAKKIQSKAARVGFDWANAHEAMVKLPEEFGELDEAICANEDISHVGEELGDLLFSVVNVARLLKIDPEIALRQSAIKFMERFDKMEKIIQKDNLDFTALTLSELDVFWERVK